MGLLYLKHESAAPSSPAAGKSVIYPKTDKVLYCKDESGNETPLSAAPFDYDNRISNPNGTIDQRNAGAAKTINVASYVYTVDRWCATANAAGTFTVHRETTNGEDCILLDVGTADASLAAADYYILTQKIEGYNVADLRFGQSDAKVITLSFEVKSSVTGTFPVAFINSANSRSYVSSFTVNAANTWEAKTITFTADTTGTWLYTNGVGMTLSFGLGMGSNYHASSLNTWSAGNFLSHASMTNFMADAANTMRLRKFRLRSGAAVVPFVQRSFDAEFSHCQRYFETNVPYGTAPADGVTRTDGAFYTGAMNNNTIHDYAYVKVNFKTAKRASPTMAYYRDQLIAGAGYMNINYTGVAHASDTAIGTTSIDTKGAMAYAQYDALAEFDAIVADFWWTADAEL